MLQTSIRPTSIRHAKKNLRKRPFSSDALLGAAVGAAVLESLEKRTMLNGLSFVNPTPYSITATPTAIISADLIGNGKQDVVTVSNDGMVSVSLSNGDGTLQLPTYFSDGLAAGPSEVVAVGDINGDGHPDLLVSSAKSKEVAVLLGVGNGTFQAPTMLNVSHQVLNLAVADVNNDGRPDLIVENYNGSVSVFISNSDGTFQLPITSEINGEAGSNLIVAGDFNGDGNVDLAIGNYDYGTITVLLGNGTGGFTATGSDYHIGQPISLSAADVNDDGHLDIVATTSSGAITLMGNGASFTPSATTSLGGDVTSAVVGDFNGDGIPDLLASVGGGSSGQAMLFLGNGDGTFQAPTVLPNGIGMNNTAYSQIVAEGDLSGNGEPDIIIGDPVNVTIDVIQNTTTGGLFFAPEKTTPIGIPTSGITSADLNGDGNDDLVLVNAGGNSVEVLLGNGDGTFKAPAFYTVPNDPVSVAVADMNGDGIPDIIVGSSASSYVSILLGNGDGTFQAAVSTCVPGGVADGPQAIAVGDFNGDGDMDVAVAGGSDGQVSILFGSNSATLQPAVTALTIAPDDDGDITGVVRANLNGDGRPDLVLIDSSYDNIDVALNSGTGTFSSYSSYNVTNGVSTVTVAALSSSGYRDLIGTQANSDSVVLFLGNGDGSFTPGATVNVNGGAVSTAVSDVNGDGNPDLLVTTINGGGNRLQIFPGNGDGTFASPLGFAAGVTDTGLAVGDFNNDGRPDVVTADANDNSLHVLLNTTSTQPVFTSPTTDTFTAGSPSSFLITTAGFPEPSITNITVTDGSGPVDGLPNGLTFQDNGNGTATIAGNPGFDSGGTYVLTLNASNGISPDAQQTVTLTVNEAPTITSPSTATLGTGTGSVSFVITTVGFPTSTISTDSELPGGLTFQDNGDGTATISGTPPLGSEGVYPITITAHNGQGDGAVQNFTLTLAHTTVMMGTAGMVMVMGSDASDNANVAFSGGDLVVTIDGQPTSFAMNSVSMVQVLLGGGDDSLMVMPNVPVSLDIGGGIGSDTVMAMNGMPDTVRGGAGNDSVGGDATGGSDSLRGGMGNDTIQGGGDGSMVEGNPGNDVLEAGNVTSTIMGGGGNDTLISATSGNMLMGGAGDDTFFTFGDNGDSVNGGAGLNFAQNNPLDKMTDIFAVIDPTPPPSQSLPTVQGQVSPAAASGAITATESGGVLTINGTANDDEIVVSGDSSNITVLGGTNSDSLSIVATFALAGLTGIDASGFGGNDSITVDSAVTLQTTLSGGAGDDSITGGGGSNVLVGGAGDDTLAGGLGTNLLVPGNLNTFSGLPGGNDLLIGGSGFSIADFSYRTDHLFLSNDGTDDSGDVGEGEHVTIEPSVAGLWGGTSGDTIVGTTGGEFLSGGLGGDSIAGGGADDLIAGGLGKNNIAVAAEPVTLYVLDGKSDTVTGVNDPAEDLIQRDLGLDQILIYAVTLARSPCPPG